MKRKQWTRFTGKMVCTMSLMIASVVSTQAQSGDPFGGGGAEDPDAVEGGFDGGGGAVDPFAAEDPFDYRPRIFRKGRAAELLKGENKQIAVMVEMVKLDHFAANELLLTYGKDANNSGDLRMRLMVLVKDGDAELTETLWGRSPLNEVAKISALVEKIYPTEYEPPELPNVVSGTPTKQPGQAVSVTSIEIKGDIYTAATPSAFETRNVGTTLEFEAAESTQQPGKLGLSIYLNKCEHLQDDDFVVEGREQDARGTSNIIMPRFSNIEQEFLVTVTPGTHSLLGIYKEGGEENQNKRVLILLHTEMIASE